MGVVQQLLVDDPLKRPTAIQLQAHPFFADVTKTGAEGPPSTLVEEHSIYSVWDHGPGTRLFLTASQLLESTWAKKDEYHLNPDEPVIVREIRHPSHQKRYDEYVAQLSEHGESLLFHGCSQEAMPSIIERGFLKSYWTTAAGSWQRFGPGFYFALQSSKSHDYPLREMRALPAGNYHRRKMLLCKVASGRQYRTRVNMSQGEQVPPVGFDSVHGEAGLDSALNYDELVVYEEAAILPFATVEYGFTKS
jgi:hypothetical protein